MSIALGLCSQFEIEKHQQRCGYDFRSSIRPIFRQEGESIFQPLRYASIIKKAFRDTEASKLILVIS